MAKYVPQLITQSKNIVDQISYYDFKSYIKPRFNITLQLATNIGTWGMNIFIAPMLRLFCMLEKRKVIYFLNRFKNSKISSFCLSPC